MPAVDKSLSDVSSSPVDPAAVPSAEAGDKMSADRPGPSADTQSDAGAAGASSPSSDPSALDPDAPWGRKPDGTPRSKPGRKPSVKADPASVTRNPRPRVSSSQSPAPAPSATPITPEAAANVAANLWFNVGVLVLSEEWAPDTAAGEHVAVRDAFKDYFQAKGVVQVSPEVALCIVLGGYTIKRVQRPTIKSKLKGAWTWVSTKILRRS